ncbi:undecaprenyldiphospho-muramoylpentapeptide beta-N- acetylglucosaminyltransferase [compost metagenome]
MTFGGADEFNLSCKCLEYLYKFSDRLTITIVLGSHYRFESEIQKLLARSSKHTVTIFRNVTEMAELMLSQDMVVSAGGSTLYELACLGIPTCSVVTAENQRELVEQFAYHKAVISLGNVDHLSETEFTNTVLQMITSMELRKMLSANARNLVDGLGSKRVAKYIINRINGGIYTDGQPDSNRE